MSAERYEFTVVLDSVGDPRLYELVGPRCASAMCHRLLRGQVIRVGEEFFHKYCAPRDEATPDPSRWREPKSEASS